MKFLDRLSSGLSKSSGRLQDSIGGIFTKARLDGEALEKLEEALIEADLGAKTAAQLIAVLSEKRFDKEISAHEVKEFLAAEIAAILTPHAAPLAPDVSKKPSVILVVGVNGNGKTTTIGKLAAQFKFQGKSVMLAAADTFRAAAAEQLEEWGRRSQVPVVTGAPQSDPASVAFRALQEAKTKGADVLLIDTAGRLQNKADLMAELKKISDVLKKLDPSAPHHVVQVLDATTGQNALIQVQAFRDMVQVTGLVVTKLDGTARGGVVVALAGAFSLPVHAVGIGEGIGDLGPFDPIDFSRNLLGLPTEALA